MSPDLIRNAPIAALRQCETMLIARLQSLGRIGYESDKVSRESQIDIESLRFVIGLDLKIVRDEIAVRDRLFPVGEAA